MSAPDWPPQPTRCPHCRLLIGEGRAKDTPDANPGARGTAAGVFAHRAKRDDDGDPASPEEVCEAIRTVARELGARPERLLMVDYQQHAVGGPVAAGALRRLRRLRQLEARQARGCRRRLTASRRARPDTMPARWRYSPS